MSDDRPEPDAEDPPPDTDAPLETEPDGDPPEENKGRRRDRNLLLIAIAVVAVVTICCIWQSRPGDDSSIEVLEMPTTSTTSSTAPSAAGSAPGPAVEAEPYQGDPLWTYPSTGEIEAIAPVGAGFLIHDGGELRYEVDGAEVWSRRTQAQPSSVQVVDETVIFGTARLEGLDSGRAVAAFDVTTGDELWRVESAQSAAAFASLVFVIRSERQDTTPPTSSTVLAAHDLRDGSERWSAELGTDLDQDPSFMLEATGFEGFGGGGPLPPQLLVNSHPAHSGGSGQEVSLYDTATGEPLAVHTADLGYDVVEAAHVSGDMVLIQWAQHRNEVVNCSSWLTAFPVGSEEIAWERWVDVRPSEGEQCLPPATLRADDGLLPASIDGNPILIDIATGESVWNGEFPGYALGLAGSTLVTSEGDDRSTPATVWNTETSAARSVGSNVLGPAWPQGTRLWTALSGVGTVVGYDPATAEAIALPGRFVLTLPDAVVTEVDGEWQAWPVDI